MCRSYPNVALPLAPNETSTRMQETSKNNTLRKTPQIKQKVAMLHPSNPLMLPHYPINLPANHPPLHKARSNKNPECFLKHKHPGSSDSSVLLSYFYSNISSFAFSLGAFLPAHVSFPHNFVRKLKCRLLPAISEKKHLKHVHATSFPCNCKHIWIFIGAVLVNCIAL